MTTYIALLRGINVGGKQPVSMTALRALVGKLGFVDAQSLLQSGNLVFRGAAPSTPRIEWLLETEAQRRLDLTADFLVRTAVEWQKVVARNPFRAEARKDPSHLLVMFLKRAAGPRAVRTLQGAIVGVKRCAPPAHSSTSSIPTVSAAPA